MKRILSFVLFLLVSIQYSVADTYTSYIIGGIVVDQNNSPMIETVSNQSTNNQPEETDPIIIGNDYYIKLDYDNALIWYKKAADQGVLEAFSLLGDLYSNNRWSKKNDKLAFNYFLEAAKGGMSYAQNRIGVFYNDGIGTQIDYQKAHDWFIKSAEQNNENAQFNLGVFYSNDLGTPKNYKIANQWFLKHVNKNPDSAFFLAHIFEEGYDDMIKISKDIDQALFWYEKADEYGSKEAKEAIKRLRDAQQSAQKRLALIIGNGDYQNTSLSLLNPTNDALDLTKKLKNLGFDIFSLPQIPNTNQDLQTMDKTTKAFCQQAKEYDVALFFYSGHAVQYQGENYLIPVNVKDIDDEGDVKYECFNMSRFMERLAKSGVKTKIIILDACRNNPFSNSRGITPQGLAAMSGSEGSYLAFSAQAGKRAQDGKGQRNSPYTAALLKMLDVPGLNISELFEQVKELVLQSTNNQQWPSETNNMRGKFYFNLNVNK